MAAFLLSLKKVTPPARRIFPLTLGKYDALVRDAAAQAGFANLCLSPHTARHGSASRPVTSLHLSPRGLPQAENAVEIADCGAPRAVEIAIDEDCAVNAENAAELLACTDTTLGTTYEECTPAAHLREGRRTSGRAVVSRGAVRRSARAVGYARRVASRGWPCVRVPRDGRDRCAWSAQRGHRGPHAPVREESEGRLSSSHGGMPHCRRAHGAWSAVAYARLGWRPREQLHDALPQLRVRRLARSLLLPASGAAGGR